MTTPITITLNSPITLTKGGPVTSELTIREPTIVEMERSADANGYRSNIKLLAAITGQAIPVIEKMGYRDFTAAMEALQKNFLSDPETGDDSAPS